ncbi:MAG: YbjQ family protein [Patescibacteria group bacterium]|jgi:uncharacterized protein YbjQ (UPF0145 family)
MIITTTSQIPGKEISEILGVARGGTVRARNIGRDIFAGLKNLVGGEISEYTKLQAEAREEAFFRMEEDAKRLGADAVVGLKMSTSVITQGASEILFYGTAVKLK